MKPSVIVLILTVVAIAALFILSTHAENIDVSHYIQGDDKDTYDIIPRVIR